MLGKDEVAGSNPAMSSIALEHVVSMGPGVFLFAGNWSFSGELVWNVSTNLLQKSAFGHSPAPPIIRSGGFRDKANKPAGHFLNGKVAGGPSFPVQGIKKYRPLSACACRKDCIDFLRDCVYDDAAVRYLSVKGWSI